MSRRTLRGAVVAATAVVVLGSPARLVQAQVAAARGVEPVILTGAQVPAWSGPAADVQCMPYPSGALTGARDAHNGTDIAPPAVGVAVDQIVAYRWDGLGFVEIPVQVDQKYFYCLSNPPSGFAIYSGTDRELTYQWDVESWKKIGGTCTSQYAPGEGPKPDPVPTLDNDDEIVFMASDAGSQAPLGALAPPGTSNGQAVAIVDPLDASTTRFAYLYLKAGGSSFNTANGYVSYVRDANADEWIDKCSFRDDSPEKLGTSNTTYGPNLSGTVCRTVSGAPGGCPNVADGTPRPSTDRFARDGATVSTDTYQWPASARSVIRRLQAAKPGQPGVYGPDLMDRRKGRASRPSTDATLQLVGFEDEQVNWEGNNALL